ncbi:MAG: cytochrome c biogenesis protein CcsA, partial [Planctomycetaceae bacterium]|nr:cytochrome c biogenesis protein CcsA [Planctomycetaceae bacterium]
PDSNTFNLYRFANTPVAWRGRSQPIDTFARAQLLKASHKSTFKGELEQRELDQRRDKIVAAVQSYWSDVDSGSLQNFSGQYSDWIEEIVRITQSGREAVEARMRDVMVARMPAIRWLLDTAARPELAERHRIIRIDNDKVLSLLGLEKRPGMVYSLAEIQPNLKELESIHRQARMLQSANQTARMEDLDRGVVALFDAVRSVNDAGAAFQRETAQGLVDAFTRAQFLFERLEGFSMITATPTGLPDAQRSWETFIAAGAVRNAADEMRKLNLTTEEQVKDYVSKTLPRQMVETAIQGTHKMVEAWVREELKEGEEPEPDAVKKFAVQAAMVQEDPFLKLILAHIALAEPGTSADDILASLDDEQIGRIAAPRLGSALTAIDDVGKRAGRLLYNSKDRDFFVAATNGFERILEAWEDKDIAGFNDAVDSYQALLADEQPAHLNAASVKQEAYFNFYEPFWKAIYLYLPVILLSFCSWLVWPKTLRWTAFWIMFVAFVVHTLALNARMEISGRLAPVTSLYSSAIFIGWAVVLASFVIELVVKRGVGNILGASCGAATLVIAHFLAIDEGDTMGVMQAVLDTTFWLATHVVCITLGYAATFLAGALGLAYCVLAIFRTDDHGKAADLKRTGSMLYGVLCFALFFSLVGTVLGGLWADDSWGRFWGW